MATMHECYTTTIQEKFMCTPSLIRFDTKMFDQIQLIGTYMELSSQQVSFHQTEDKQSQLHSNISTLPQTLGKLRLNSQNQEQKVKIKSIFHNFQKHLVVTLKTDINLSRNANNNSNGIVVLANTLWELFISTNLYSKKVLHFLFGVSQIQEENFIQILSYQIPGSQQVMNSCSNGQFAAAQEYLRSLVAKQGKKLLLRKLLRHRRMVKNEQYKIFFNKFLQELQKGPLSRRIPKTEKIKILEEIIIKQSM